MKLLIFEFITGGGFLGQALPDTLLKEGRLMLQALLHDVAELSDYRIYLPLDPRVEGLSIPDSCCILSWPDDGLDLKQTFSGWLNQVDVIWFIAPESELILFQLIQQAEQLGKRVLNCSSSAVRVCTDKLQTLECLQQVGIETPMSMPLTAFRFDPAMPVVVKPQDGVGCHATYRIQTLADYQHLLSFIDPESMIVQEWIAGDVLSLSVLCLPNRSQILCCNRQHVCITEGQFELRACEVNIDSQAKSVYQSLVNQVGEAIEGLYGYIGIDLIQPIDGPAVILEINPRLTTSYAGLRQALGINVATCLLEGRMLEFGTISETVMITLE
jgi:predicted ATP-grasp superfamily ATP-dependent carboligase